MSSVREARSPHPLGVGVCHLKELQHREEASEEDDEKSEAYSNAIDAAIDEYHNEFFLNETEAKA